MSGRKTKEKTGLLIDNRVLNHFRIAAQNAYPREVVALLDGTQTKRGLRIDFIYVLSVVGTEDSVRIPAQMVKDAEKICGRKFIAHIHSHPNEYPFCSEKDYAMLKALKHKFSIIMEVVKCKDGFRGSLAAWQKGTPIPLRIERID